MIVRNVPLNSFIAAPVFLISKEATTIVTRGDSERDAGSSDFIDAGEGDDQVTAGMGADIVLLGDGTDGAFGMEGNDIIFGGEGDDGLRGDGVYVENASSNSSPQAIVGFVFADDDTLFGEGGNDRLIGGVGSDYLDGGIGADQLFGDTDSYFSLGNMLWIPGQYHGNDTLRRSL